MTHTSALILLTAIVSASANDLIIGHNFDGRVILDENFEASPALWRQTTSFCINATIDNEVISAVNITDLRPGKDGEAKITEGGVGLRDVTIELKSPTVLRGYGFHVKVYAIAKTADGLSTTEAIKDINNQPSFIGLDGRPNLNDRVRTNLDNKRTADTSRLSTSTTESAVKSDTRITRDVTEGISHPGLVKKEDSQITPATVSEKNNHFTTFTATAPTGLKDFDSQGVENSNGSKFNGTTVTEVGMVTTQTSTPSIVTAFLDSSQAPRKVRDTNDAKLNEEDTDTIEAITTKPGDDQTQKTFAVPSILGNQDPEENVTLNSAVLYTDTKSINDQNQTVVTIPPLPYTVPKDDGLAAINSNDTQRHIRDVISSNESLAESSMEKSAENQTRKFISNPKLYAEEDEDDEEEDMTMGRTVKSISPKCTSPTCDVDYTGNDESINDPNLSRAS